MCLSSNFWGGLFIIDNIRIIMIIPIYHYLGPATKYKHSSGECGQAQTSIGFINPPDRHLAKLMTIQGGEGGEVSGR